MSTTTAAEKRAKALAGLLVLRGLTDAIASMDPEGKNFAEYKELSTMLDDDIARVTRGEMPQGPSAKSAQPEAGTVDGPGRIFAGGDADGGSIENPDDIVKAVTEAVRTMGEELPDSKPVGFAFMLVHDTGDTLHTHSAGGGDADVVLSTLIRHLIKARG